MNTIQSDLHIGVDVGKHQLDFYCHETGEHFTVTNKTGGIREALKQLPLRQVACLVVEATGRHEQALVRALPDKTTRQL